MMYRANINEPSPASPGEPGAPITPIQERMIYAWICHIF